MNDINNDEIKSILHDISQNIIIPKYKNLDSKDIKFKNKNNKDLVTIVDVAVEKKLQKKLNLLLPNSLFVGEESFAKKPEIIEAYNEKQYCWTVDPIDGTTNFVKGKEKFAIMVALSFGEKILQSWIYKPLTYEFSYAKLGDVSYINSKKTSINNLVDISEATGSISSKYWEEKYVNKMKKIKFLFKEVKSFGCIAFEYVDIIKGNRDFAILSKLSPWDHIAGILLVREAGGSDIHFDLTNYKHNIRKNNLIVANSIILQNRIMSLIEE
jgi:fructose-1,6-bisphosphatase/inositol monophosphatase family enzyme